MNTWFTNESGVEGRFGANVYNPNIKNRKNIPLDTLATIFQANVSTTLSYANFQIEMRNTNIFIYFDSKVAINTLAKINTEFTVV